MASGNVIVICRYSTVAPLSHAISWEIRCIGLQLVASSFGLLERRAIFNLCQKRTAYDTRDPAVGPSADTNDDHFVNADPGFGDHDDDALVRT